MNRYHSIQLSKRVATDLKKIRKKDKVLYEKVNKTIMQLRIEPYIGERKTGDLQGIFSIDIRHVGVNYELAYALVKEENTVIIVIMFGTRENFYKTLKRYLRENPI